MNTHFHFIVWAAMDKSGGSFSEVTYVDLIAENEEDAIKKAKQIAPKRRHYWVNNIIEKHGDVCGEHEH